MNFRTGTARGPTKTYPQLEGAVHKVRAQRCQGLKSNTCSTRIRISVVGPSGAEQACTSSTDQDCPVENLPYDVSLEAEASITKSIITQLRRELEADREVYLEARQRILARVEARQARRLHGRHVQPKFQDQRPALRVIQGGKVTPVGGVGSDQLFVFRSQMPRS